MSVTDAKIENENIKRKKIKEKTFVYFRKTKLFQNFHNSGEGSVGPVFRSIDAFDCRNFGPEASFLGHKEVFPETSVLLRKNFEPIKASVGFYLAMGEG